MILGISLVIASACVFNNYIDRDIDKKMARTRKRAIVTGNISPRNALIYATVLGLIGTYLLSLTNLLATAIGLFGLFAYVVLYGIAKRASVWGTVIGSISGAVPPVVGYCAVTNRLDLGALLLFIVLVFWQMPHFYAIALYRQKDYESAKIPVLPIVKGRSETINQILHYIIGFSVAVFALTYFKYTGFVYLFFMSIVCILWIRLALQGFKVEDTDKWARKLFGFSLITLLTFSALLSINALLP